MLSKIYEFNNYKYCIKSVLELVEKNKIIKDTTDISMNRGDIPINCPHKDFYEILKNTEVITEDITQGDIEPTIIYKKIICYDKKKLDNIKEKLGQ